MIFFYHSLEDIGVKIHLNKKRFLRDLINETDVSAQVISMQIRGLALSELPLKLEISRPPPVGNNEKAIDRVRALHALLALYPEGDSLLHYSDEASIVQRTMSQVVHGNFDLVIGHSDNLVVCGLFDPCLGETKSGNRLTARRVRKSKNSFEWCLKETVQPILQAIFVAQMQAVPVACFTMTKSRCRPYIYYPEQDVLFTTIRDYAWIYDNKIGLRGCILLSLLMGNQWKTCTDVGLITTNFVKAWKKVKIGTLAENAYIAFRKERRQEGKILSDSEDEYYESKVESADGYSESKDENSKSGSEDSESEDSESEE